MSEKRTCPVESCTTAIKAGFLMCKLHWHMVPRREQREIYRTWRNYLSAPSVKPAPDQPAPKATWLGAYMAAVRVAMISIEREIARIVGVPADALRKDPQ